MAHRFTKILEAYNGFSAQLCLPLEVLRLTHSLRSGRTSNTVALRGTLKRRTRTSQRVPNSRCTQSTTSEYSLNGRGRSETSFFWMSRRS